MWDLFYKLKMDGGLGLGRISLRSKACLGKRLWRFLKEINAFWHRIVLSIYGLHSNGWDTNTVVRWWPGWPWKAISHVFNGFSNFTRYLVRGDMKICLWEDTWLVGSPLEFQFPNVFQVIRTRNMLVFSIVDRSSTTLYWNFNFRWNLFDLVIEELTRLLSSWVMYLSPLFIDE